MISRDCIITVNGNKATIDSDIYLYKYDKNIQLAFAIINSKYMYDNDDSNNLIKNMQAAYAQVKFKKDDSADIEIEFDIQATNKGAVLLTINEELTDEDTELGEYTIQIRLLDSNKNSVVTLPPVESCIHIQAPLFEKMGSDTNVVNKAVVNKAVARYAAPLSATTADGTFNSKEWVDGDKITTAELNRMETGIKTNSTNQINLIEDDTSMEGISDSEHDTLTTTNKKIIPAINEINAQCKDIENKKIDTVALSNNELTFSANNKTIKTITLPTFTGLNGKEVELQKSTTHIQWRYVGDTQWLNLVALSDLKGAKGDTGATPNLQIGNVTTLNGGSNATASITGTTENPLLNLGIPGSDILVTTNISGTTLSLTTDKYQIATVKDGTEITLPTITSFKEIHLFFNATTDLTLILPSCKWQNGNTPTISANKTYEFIFTHTTEWLGGVIVYE